MVVSSAAKSYTRTNTEGVLHANQYSGKKDSPLEKANTLSRWFFYWMNPIFRTGNQRQLNEADLYKLPNAETVARVQGRFEREWELEQERVGPDGEVRFGLVLRNVFSFHFWVAGILKFLNDVLGLCLPIILNFLLLFLEDEDGDSWPEWSGWVLLSVLVGTSFMKALVENQFFYQVTRISLQIRSAVASAVFNKSLRLSSLSRNTSTTGEIVNLMQLDAERLSILVLQLHILWSGAFQIIGYMTQLFFYLGPSALAGVLAMPIFIVIQGYFMKKQETLRKGQVKETDTRVKHMNELLQGIRAVKMYAWEERFGARIESIRNTGEMVFLKAIAIVRAFNFALISASPTLILVITFLFYTAVANEKMKASTVFTAVAVFERLR